MERFHSAAQHNHEVISSFWLLCKTSEIHGLKGRHKLKISTFYIIYQVFAPICAINIKNGEGEGCKRDRADITTVNHG